MTHGFKELASVCQAIAAGRQSVLLRKAGLRESTFESGFQTTSFYLLPTHYHEKNSKEPVANFQISIRVDVLRSGDLLNRHAHTHREIHGLGCRANRRHGVRFQRAKNG